VLVVLAVLVVAGVALRLALPNIVRFYVQRALDRNHEYSGLIGTIHVSLWRGAYAIEDIRLLKATGSVPVPFFAARRVDLAIEWPALLHGKVVGRMRIEQPEINFVDAESPSDAQTGAGGPWMQVIKDLFPFAINSAEVRNGKIAFRAFHTDPPVDVYLSDVAATIENLSNVRDEVTPLFAVVRADGLAMDDARLEYEMQLDPLAYRPTFRFALRLVGLDVTKLNSLAKGYGGFDFEHGWFDLVVEMDAREGGVEGYVKPLFRNLRVFDPGDGGFNLLAKFWEAIVGAAAALLKNQPHDQLATVIPVRGDLADPDTDVLALVGNLLRNAFIRAYLPRFQGTPSDRRMLTFAPGQSTDVFFK